MPSGTQNAILARRHILVVEDAYFIADDMATALRQAGATVVGPAPNREVGMALLAAGPIDAAVLDINLRGDVVFPLADALMARGTPFVFATGYSAASIPDAYRHVARWEKPFDFASLVRVLPDLIGNR